MNKLFLALLLSIGFTSIACEEKTYERTTEHKTDDGTTVKEHKKVTENDEGDKTVTHERSVDRDHK